MKSEVNYCLQKKSKRCTHLCLGWSKCAPSAHTVPIFTLRSGQIIFSVNTNIHNWKINVTYNFFFNFYSIILGVVHIRPKCAPLAHTVPIFTMKSSKISHRIFSVNTNIHNQSKTSKTVLGQLHDSLTSRWRSWWRYRPAASSCPAPRCRIQRGAGIYRTCSSTHQLHTSIQSALFPDAH